MRLAPCVLALPMAACLLTKPIEKPTAVVRDASLSSSSLTAIEGQLALDVSNPNAIGLPLTGIDWEVAIGGSRGATGRVELNQTIPAMGSAPVTTSLRIDLRDAVAVASAVASGARDYQLAARLHFSTQLGELTVDVRHQGTLSGAGSILGAHTPW